MGTLVVWFALGFVLSWLRVLPIDNVAHTAGGTAGALGALWAYRSEWKRSRSMGKRRKAWKRAMNAEPSQSPDPLSVAAPGTRPGLGLAGIREPGRGQAHPG